jgi:hypothetical protein
MKKLLLILCVAALSACTTVVKVEGDQIVNGRLAVKLPDAWNKLTLPANKQPFEVWTQEGMTLDHLRFWAAIKPGQSLLNRPTNNTPAGEKAPRLPTYTKGMAPDQLVSLFETLYSADGSLVAINQVDAATFAGQPGVRFEFSVARKSDDVQLKGVGWVAVRGDELFAATFVAPRLSFFGRLLPKAEGVVKTAQIIKGG